MKPLIQEPFLLFARARGQQNIDQLSPKDQHQLFEHFSAYHILRGWHLKDMTPLDTNHVIIGGLYDQQLDAVAVVMKDRLITTAEQFEQVAAEPDADVVKIVFIQSTVGKTFDLHKMQTFANGATMVLSNEQFFRENSDLSRQRELTHAIIEQFPADERDNVQIFLYFVCLSESGQDNDELLSSWRKWAENQIIKAGFRSVTAEALNADRLRQCIDRVSSDGALASPQVVTNYCGQIPADHLVAVPCASGSCPGYIGYVRAQDFLKLLERSDGQGLLESVFTENVRGFKGINSAINKAIGETLSNPQERGQFFLRNNGITMVADKAEPVGDSLSVLNYQIVNGLQTSHVLYHHRRHFDDTAEVHVPIKVAITSDVMLKDAIIECTNRQSAITDLEFLGRRQMLRTVESYFEQKRQSGRGPGIVLERRPGQFHATRGLPQNKIISVRDLMLAYASVFLELPHEAKAGPAKVVKRVPSQIFHEGHPADPYFLAGWILYLSRERCENRDAKGFPAFHWHLAFALRRLLANEAVPTFQSPVALAEFCERLYSKLSRTSDVSRCMRTAFGIVLGAVKNARKGQDVLALAKTTNAIQSQISHALRPTRFRKP